MPVRLLAILYFGTGENSFWHSETTNTALFKGRFQSLFYKQGTRDCAIIIKRRGGGGGRGMPCLSLRQTNVGVSQSTVSCQGIPNMSGSKSSARGSPPRERKIEACPFSYVFTSCELPLFPYFSLLFPFSCFRCCGFCANLICRLIFSHHSVQVLNKM